MTTELRQRAVDETTRIYGNLEGGRPWALPEREKLKLAAIFRAILESMCNLHLEGSLLIYHSYRYWELAV